MQLGNVEFYQVSVISDLQLRVIKFKWRDLEARVSELDGSHTEDVTHNLMRLADELSKPKFSVLAGAVTGDEKPDFQTLISQVPLVVATVNEYVLPILVRTLKIRSGGSKDYKRVDINDLKKFPQAFYVMCVIAGFLANIEQYQDLWRILVVDILKKNAVAEPETMENQKKEETAAG